MSGRLEERTVPGLHDYLASSILPACGPGGGAAADLGTGTGAFATRLSAAGYDVVCCDVDGMRFAAELPFVSIDLNEPRFAEQLGRGRFEIVTAVEVIEHLESPLAFLRNVRALLSPDGVALLTTPNLDSIAARLKFLLKGKIRLMDEHGDATHLSPIFWDLLSRQYLPRAGLRLVTRDVYPPGGFAVGRPTYRPVLRAVAPFFRRGALVGDVHVLVLAAQTGVSSG